MVGIRLSVVIPSYKDPWLHPTIDSLLANSELGDRLEVIPVLDGYWPEQSIRNDDRVRIVHLGKNVGMKEAINAGMRVARGEYLMRSDEHCSFGKGYDRILTQSCQPNWIITARRYFLDPVRWEIMKEKGYVDYEKLVTQTIGNAKKFTGYPWQERTNKRKDVVIDETMAMQGSMWVMARSWWNKVIGDLVSGPYGTHYQDSHEMVFKTWKKGGKMMVNKNTWYAHRHNSFPRRHNLTHASQQKELQAFYDKWKDYYLEIKRKWRI